MEEDHGGLANKDVTVPSVKQSQPKLMSSMTVALVSLVAPEFHTDTMVSKNSPQLTVVLLVDQGKLI